MQNLRVSNRHPGQRIPAVIFVSSRDPDRRLDIGGASSTNRLHTMILVVTSFEDQRKDSVVIDGIEYPLNWNDKDPALQSARFYLGTLKVHRDTRSALIKVYDMISNLLTYQNRKEGINGYLLVEALLALSRIYERRREGESVDRCFDFARRLDPVNPPSSRIARAG